MKRKPILALDSRKQEKGNFPNLHESKESRKEKVVNLIIPRLTGQQLTWSLGYHLHSYPFRSICVQPTEGGMESPPCPPSLLSPVLTASLSLGATSSGNLLMSFLQAYILSRRLILSMFMLPPTQHPPDSVSCYH